LQFVLEDYYEEAYTFFAGLNLTDQKILDSFLLKLPDYQLGNKNQERLVLSFILHGMLQNFIFAIR
jgi:hypothetical protein